MTRGILGRGREEAVFVACSTLCFGRLPLERALRLIGELEFSKVDVAIHESGPHLRPSQVVQDVTLAGQHIRIGPSLTPAALSAEIETPDPAEFRRQLRALCRLARLSMIPQITLPAAAASSNLDDEIHRLDELVRLVETEGVQLSLPSKIGTLTENPAIALELCRAVPGLGLTLDPSHFIQGPFSGASYDELFPYIRHVHLRDTGRRPGQFQVRIGQGEVEYGRIISLLERFGYDRLLTVAMHDGIDPAYPMEAEVRKLKYLLESLV